MFMNMQEGGQVHQMDHTRGDIALSPKRIPRETFVHLEIGHVLLVKDTMAEDQFNSLSKLLSPSISNYVISYYTFLQLIN